MAETKELKKNLTGTKKSGGVKKETTKAKVKENKKSSIKEQIELLEKATKEQLENAVKDGTLYFDTELIGTEKHGAIYDDKGNIIDYNLPDTEVDNGPINATPDVPADYEQPTTEEELKPSEDIQKQLDEFNESKKEFNEAMENNSGEDVEELVEKELKHAEEMKKHVEETHKKMRELNEKENRRSTFTDIWNGMSYGL